MTRAGQGGPEDLAAYPLIMDAEAIVNVEFQRIRVENFYKHLSDIGRFIVGGLIASGAAVNGLPMPFGNPYIHRKPDSGGAE